MFEFIDRLISGATNLQKLSETIKKPFSALGKLKDNVVGKREQLSQARSEFKFREGKTWKNLFNVFKSTNTSLKGVESDVALDASKQEVAKVEAELQNNFTDKNNFYYSEKKVKMSRNDVIEKYTSFAIESSRKSGVPAAVIMAQFLLESGDGNSKLASYNNFFGLKCFDQSCARDTKAGIRETDHCIQRTDDVKTDRFLKFKTVQDCFDYYFKFLQQARYQPLFHSSPGKFLHHVQKYIDKAQAQSDSATRINCANNAIENWNNPTLRRIRGIRAMGYATAKNYSESLQGIIDDNKLNLLDQPIA